MVALIPEQLGMDLVDFDGPSISNLGGISEQTEPLLRGGKHFIQHSAWDHCGYVWFKDDQFHEAVYVRNRCREVMSAPSLPELFEMVNQRYGRD